MLRITPGTSVLLFLLLFSPLVSATHTDSGDQPDKPIAKLVRPLISALNSGSVIQVKNFVDRRMPMLASEGERVVEDYVGYLMSFHFSYGHLVLHSFRQYQNPLPGNEVVAILKSQYSQTWLALTIIGGDEVELIDISPASWPSDVAPLENLSQEKAIAEIAKFFARLKRRDAYSGTVLIAREDEVLLVNAAGMASKRFQVPNTKDTRFHLASVAKMFTGVALARLVAAGKIKFEDKLGVFLDSSWLPQSISQKISLAQLLNHSSGLGNSLYLQWTEKHPHRTHFAGLEYFKQFLKAEKLLFEPGTNYQYSNSGLILAGAVVEKVSGVTFHEFVVENIFKPAGMTDSGFFDLAQPFENIAVGYERNPEKPTGWVNNHFAAGLNVIGMPHGDAVSTVGDMHKFSQALKNGQLVQGEALKKLISFYAVPYAPGEVGHTGGHLGIDTRLSINLETGYTVVLLSNYTNGAVALAAKIRETLSRVEI